ncbi:hypothetical protein [Pantoea sp. BAV 3049]|uniref:hypothetical protein n=1 Tax=Pantoea sp. BAV 3049 TaxID=2654188 RepID=UPI00131E2D27|nr:hypothetical protein [Pantoea sp. BAV 3049]
MSKETGGPAFPAEAKLNRINNEAYPVQTRDGDIFQFPGLTMRDYFAAKAMQGILANPGQLDNVNDDAAKWVARDSYKVADAMITARNK